MLLFLGGLHNYWACQDYVLNVEKVVSIELLNLINHMNVTQRIDAVIYTFCVATIISENVENFQFLMH